MKKLIFVALAFSLSTQAQVLVGTMGGLTMGGGNGTAATPTFSPVAGAVSNPTTVTISTATGACSSYIYSKTSSGVTSGDTHSNTFSVTGAGTWYAKVIGCPGYSNSAEASAAYTISAGGTLAYQASSYRDSAFANGVATVATSSTVSVPAGATVVAFVGHGNQQVSSVTDGGSNSLTSAAVNNNGNIGAYSVDVWIKTNATANATATFTATFSDLASYPSVQVVVFTGVTSIDTFTCSSAACDASVTTATTRLATNTATTASANEILVYGVVENAVHTYTAANSFILASPNGQDHAVFYKIVSSTGAYPGGNVATVNSQSDNGYFATFVTLQ